ncbi:hybrid sensor histidine kinase/response regulator [Geomonas azotofigens]|uniref:hybrid sensor histidine kinase/response regulator n=1 Tax=Geomonas azotofigens TaxID=2843196 RepID=UPI001C114C7D|nr:response regulator [Geomonas azotofigens]MBU5614212.1 response regulator [Geomonas azotofigens]
MLVDGDLTKQFLYEALSRGKREWELTFDAVPDLIFITDTQHTITRANRAMADRLGMRPSELPGRKCYDLFHEIGQAPDTCPFLKLLQEGEAPNVEMEEQHLGGFFEISVSPLYNELGEITACVHVARDVTERKKAEEYRLALEQQLQQTQRLESLGVLSGGIAHDFNNILTIILGHCAMARTASSDQVKQHLEQIELAGNRAADLCRQMLNYAGKSPLVQTEIDLSVQVREVVSMLQPAFKKKVSFRYLIEPDIPLIKGDQGQVQQIIMNLVVNAVEAIGDRKGTVGIALSEHPIGADEADRDVFGNQIPPGSYVCLEVNDDGCGMSDETRQRLFEPFFTTKFTGRGLGMSATMGIIKGHSGALQLASAPGAGSTFKIFFPTCPATDLPRGAVSDAKPPRPSLEPLQGTILLVDDEPELRQLGTVLLNGLGLRVMTARNGREALDVYRQHSQEIDLVLMDLTMPEMDGVEAYQELRRETTSLPILFCSGYGKKEVSPFIDSDPRAAFLAKPYHPGLMRESLARLLSRSGVDS